MSSTNTQVYLRSRPTAAIEPKTDGSGTFGIREAPAPQEKDLKADQVLIEVKYCSLDPAMRGWLRDARSYLPPVQIDEVMRSAGLGVVVASTSDKFKKGDEVSATTGWQKFVVLPAKQVEKIPKREGAEMIDALGVFGSSGLTAYFGLFEVAKLKEGDVVVVTGAAGSVGSIAVQLAKLKGCTVIATAGSDDKVKWLKEELGADDAINYKNADFAKQLRDVVCKKHKFADVVFENVGGETLDILLTCLKPHARIAFCGSVSQYSKDSGEVYGLKNYMSLIGMKAKLEGFIVFDFIAKYDQARDEMAGWIKEGKLKRLFHISEKGLSGAPQALVDLFAGVNKGKALVKV